MKLVRYFNTIKYLKLSQITNRLRLFFHPYRKDPLKEFENVKFKQTDLFIKPIHSDETFLKRFQFNEQNNSVTLLNKEIELDFTKLSRYSPLEQYNLQYFEYAIAWAQTRIKFDFFKKTWKDYVSSNLVSQPYVISMQIPNLIIASNIYGIYDQSIYNDLYSRYKWLLKHQEKHLLANHYFENIKAILLASYVFSEDKVFEKYKTILKKECKRQILEDGAHFELSLMYQKIIIEDLLLIYKICKEDWIKDYLTKMVNATASLENGFNRIPLFNDAGDNVTKPISSLIKACEEEFGYHQSLTNIFPNSGYYKLYSDDIAVMIDAGIVGPSYNPGHAHCDCLSFELFKNNQPILVNSGTYQYQGEFRSLFRSTKAHNTLMVDGREQSECWGEHRVAKRIRRVDGSLIDNRFEGSYTNIRGNCHSRLITLEDGVLKVADKTTHTKNGLVVKSYLHLAPGYEYVDGAIKGFGASFPLSTIECGVSILDSIYSPEFGLLEKNKCLVFEWKTDDKEHGYIVQLGNKEITING